MPVPFKKMLIVMYFALILQSKKAFLHTATFVHTNGLWRTEMS